MAELKIRLAKPEDAEALCGIYAPYVRNTAITFEHAVPSAAEFRGRIETISLSYPYLVLEKDGEIVGYAYAHRFHERAAYDYDAETSIYLKQGIHKNGYGKLLYQTLENVLREMNILNIYALVACPEVEDEYLTFNSLMFHQHMGYTKAGLLRKSGYKFGRWYGTAYLEKVVSERPEQPKKVRKMEEMIPILTEKFGIEP